MAVISLLEPGSFRVHMQLIQRLLTCKIYDREGESIEPINVMLDSTLNIEFVYVILEGIVKICCMRLDGHDSNHMEVQDEDITVSDD